MSKVEEFLTLVRKNPDLPIVPAVNYEVVSDDIFGYWMGRFGGARLDEYVLGYGEEAGVVFKSDGDIYDALERCLPPLELEPLLNDEEAQYKRYCALPWEKAIIVYIELPEE